MIPRTRLLAVVLFTLPILVCQASNSPTVKDIDSLFELHDDLYGNGDNQSANGDVGITGR